LAIGLLWPPGFSARSFISANMLCESALAVMAEAMKVTWGNDPVAMMNAYYYMEPKR
jgi:hypothetical protein